jgi:hypothetical protein
MTLVSFFARPLLIAIVFFIPFWGCFAVRNRLNLAYTDRPLSFAVYFLLCSLVGVWLFRADFAMAPIKSNLVIPVLILLGTFLLTVAIYASGKRRIPEVAPLLQQYGSIFNKWVTLDYRYLAAKSSEVLYQQVCIVLEVLVLRTMFSSPLALALLFASLFGVLHLFIYVYWYRKKLVPGSSVIVISIFSFLGGLVMPLLILLVPFGFIYSFCVHELYYPVVGTGFRFYLGRSAKVSREMITKETRD